MRKEINQNCNKTLNGPHRNRIITLFVNISTILLIFFCFEIGCRLTKTPFKGNMIPAEAKLVHFDPKLGWSYNPNKSLIYYFGEPKRPVALYFNKDGIRVPYPRFKFDPSKPTVLFIGGSYTLGHGLFFEESFAGQFGAFENMPLQVVNLGVQAYGTDQALLALKKFITQFNTKLIVYTFIHDHIQRNGNYDRRMLYPNIRFVGTKPLFKLDNGEPTLAKKPVLLKHYINSWLLDTLRMRVGGALEIFPPQPIGLTKALIREMKKTSEGYGANFVLINWYRGHDKFYDIIQHSDAVDIIDTKAHLLDWEHLGIPGDGHPNQATHQRIANMLHEYFVRNKIKILSD